MMIIIEMGRRKIKKKRKFSRMHAKYGIRNLSIFNKYFYLLLVYNKSHLEFTHLLTLITL